MFAFHLIHHISFHKTTSLAFNKNDSFLCSVQSQLAFLTSSNGIYFLPRGAKHIERIILPCMLAKGLNHTAIIKVFSAEKHYTLLLIQGDTACVIVHTLLGPPCPINHSGDLLILLPPCGIGCSPAGSSKCLLALVSVGYLWWPVSPLILRFLPRLRQVPLSPQPSTRNSGKVWGY